MGAHAQLPAMQAGVSPEQSPSVAQSGQSAVNRAVCRSWSMPVKQAWLHVAAVCALAQQLPCGP
jgi:hypothetical protein